MNNQFQSISKKIQHLGGFKPNVLLKEVETPVNYLEHVDELKLYFDRELPDDVKSFIGKYGAVSFKKEVEIIGLDSIEVAGEGNAVSVDNFYDLSNRNTSIIEVLKSFAGNLPNNLCPICDGEAGDLIVVNMNNDYYGSIYYWEHENNKISLLASSFLEFFNKLTNREEKKIEASDVKITKVSDKFLERLRQSRK